jgi:1-acyl-sn-glycerol-3-phosphate acyltransferase
MTGFARFGWAVGETLAISVPTLVDTALGRFSVDLGDARLESWSRRCLELAQATLDVRGRDRIPAGETFVVMSNHLSYYDVPVLFQAFPGRLRMVTKKELFRVPVWGPALREAGFIPIDRESRKDAIESLKVAEEAMDHGVNVWIAPEGTRSRTGALGPFKRGGFRLALGTRRRILPVGIRGTPSILSPDGFLIKAGGHAEVEFGAPIDTVRYGLERRDQLLSDVRREIARLSGQEP